MLSSAFYITRRLHVENGRRSQVAVSCERGPKTHLRGVANDRGTSITKFTSSSLTLCPKSQRGNTRQ